MPMPDTITSHPPSSSLTIDPPGPPSHHQQPHHRHERNTSSMSIGNTALATPGAPLPSSTPTPAMPSAAPRVASPDNAIAAPSNGTSTPAASIAPSSAAPVAAPSRSPDASSKEVDEVLSSEVGVSAMLSRLKQSIGSAKEFALFLKKRSQLEEEHSNGMKKLCRHTAQMMRLAPDHRQGTFAQAYEESMVIHERMCDNSLQFAASLHHMHEDLLEMASIAEKSRKGWKQSGTTAEQRVQEIEAAMRKSKVKYDGLAEEYERVRTGEGRTGGKGFFKSTKSTAQQEEELLRKVNLADQDYRAKIETLQHERSLLMASTRPDTVKALQDLVHECDAGLALQLQKFASFNEKLLLSNGLSISPIKAHAGNPTAARSLREIAASVDNEKDASDYILSYHSKLPPRVGDIKYEKNPVLNRAPGGHAMYPGQPQGPQLLQQQPQAAQQGQQHPVQHPMSGMGGMSSPMPQQPMASQQQPLPQQQQQNKPGVGVGFGGPVMPQGAVQPMARPGGGVGMMQSPPGGSSIGSIGSPMATSSMGSSPTAASFAPGGPPTMSGAQTQPRTGSLAQIPQQREQLGHDRSLSMGQTKPAQPPQNIQFGAGRNSMGPAPRFNGTMSSQGAQGGPSGGPPQLGAMAFQSQSQAPTTQTAAQAPLDVLSQKRAPLSPSQGPLAQNPSAFQPTRTASPPSSQMAPPSRPVFGVTLEKLYERDGVPVPMVVYRCIQAIDLFGLNVEGIYRLSGSQAHVHRLRNLFDTAGADGNSPDTDFRNPENFFHDVNSVAGLLKQFFRDLPDPLLTKRMYPEFIEAAREEDPIARRDSFHALINNLPDPNYATLKALTLHLHRIIDNSATNRMGSQNLAIVFGPTLLGPSPDASSIQDAAWHSRVVDTILLNTYQIFDDD